MNTTTILVKTDVKTRDEAKKVAEASGFSLPGLIDAMLRQIAGNKRLAVNLEEIPNKRTAAMLKKSEEDVKAGRVSPTFTNAKDAIAWLNDPHAKLKNGDTVHDEI